MIPALLALAALYVIGRLALGALAGTMQPMTRYDRRTDRWQDE